MDVNRLLRMLPDGNSTLEASIAALAGFLAGQAVQGDWPLVEWIVSLLFGG